MDVADLFSGPKKPNIVIIMTDQERSLQHWPENFCKEHMPAMERLMKNGLTFKKAFTNACMCSPSRATFLTSQFPSQTGVVMTSSPEPIIHLPKDLANLATVLRKAG